MGEWEGRKEERDRRVTVAGHRLHTSAHMLGQGASAEDGE